MPNDEQLPFIQHYRVINQDADFYNQVGVLVNIVDRDDDNALRGEWLVLLFDGGTQGAYRRSELEAIENVG